MVDLEVWRMTWSGQLRNKAQTMAELFWEASYHTFWVGHDHTGVFTNKIIGLDQGFEDKQLITETTEPASLRVSDSRIVSAAIGRLKRADDQGGRFFGWVFLVGPHAPYVAHDPSLPADEPFDRYRQEVRNADEQLGRLLRYLEERGRLGDTIVVVTSDHGEEFGERGGDRHSTSLYEELTHVPLVVWIPEHRGGRVETPTSLTYLFPWLLLEADGKLQRAAESAILRDLGPLLKATDGAVLLELLGTSRNLGALVDGDLKLVYDFNSEVSEGYDLARDPHEREDLAFSDPARLTGLDGRLDRYVELRADHRRFRRDPKRRRLKEQARSTPRSVSAPKPVTPAEGESPPMKASRLIAGDGKRETGKAPAPARTVEQLDVLDVYPRSSTVAGDPPLADYLAAPPAAK
jgi:arylsulfatase A-like enzyme